MAKKSLEILTETMFYVLMALLKGEMCGTEIAVYIEEKTKERIKLGPGTLYTILANICYRKKKKLQNNRKRIRRIF